ncbi:hypothetical protein OCO53_25595 [Peribacillus frigoritolerans]|uniref:hypothetical protein n=1 Tax=Peribacillus frigoritolerans TaxID=450367 RepID=UPI0021CE32AE|nr:hypothetical protein [Peribacillus frigoritolerans]MCU6603818.1 hypothetical protein [Peribacillus frigoritolerans]
MENTYKLTFVHCEGDVQYVSTNMNPDQFELLLAYITFEGEDVNQYYPLIALDFAEQLLPLYGCKKTTDVDWNEDDDDFDIDLHYNRERYCGRAYEIQAMKKFHHPELKNVLTKVFEKIEDEQKKY